MSGTGDDHFLREFDKLRDLFVTREMATGGKKGKSRTPSPSPSPSKRGPPKTGIGML